MTTMVIEPIYSDNRSEDGAYGCSCICNVQSGTHNITANFASAFDDGEGTPCGCSCIGGGNEVAHADKAAANA